MNAGDEADEHNEWGRDSALTLKSSALPLFTRRQTPQLLFLQGRQYVRHVSLFFNGD